MIRASARDFLARECPLKMVRQVETGRDSLPASLWKKLANLGWPGLLIPEEYGGSGGTLLDMVVVLEEAGRVLLPGPLIQTVVGGVAILWGGSEDLKRRLLPQIAGGESIVTLAVVETEAGGGAYFRVVRDGNDFRVTGSKIFVPDAAAAQYIVCTFKTGDGADDVNLLLIETGTPGMTLKPLKAISGARLYEVAFNDVRVPAESMLGKREDSRGSGVGRVLRYAVVAQCAWMVGAAGRVFEMAVEYVKTRLQYGRPIAAFQSVQHQCADMAVDLWAAEYVTHYAGWKLGKYPDSSWEVSVARAWVNDACLRVASRACYLHGALGYSEEYDAQLYLRRIAGVASAFSGTRHHLEMVARGLLG